MPNDDWAMKWAQILAEACCEDGNPYTTGKWAIAAALRDVVAECVALAANARKAHVDGDWLYTNGWRACAETIGDAIRAKFPTEGE